MIFLKDPAKVHQCSATHMLTSLQVHQMDEKVSTVPHKTEAVATPPEDGTPSKPRQAGSGNGRKQPRAAKQLRFEGAAGVEGLRTAASFAKTVLHMCKHDDGSQHPPHHLVSSPAQEHTHSRYMLFCFLGSPKSTVLTIVAGLDAPDSIMLELPPAPQTQLGLSDS